MILKYLLILHYTKLNLLLKNVFYFGLTISNREQIMFYFKSKVMIFNEIYPKPLVIALLSKNDNND